MEIDLAGQKALVTGASTGIGRAVALALAGAGADVAVHYGTSLEEAERTAAGVRETGRQAHLIQGDFRDHSSTAVAVRDAAAALGGRIDVLVNNAGSLVARKSMRDMDAELWNQVIGLNLSSVFFATKAADEFLPDGARVINVSSIAAHSGGGTHAFAYAAAKGGVISLTRGLAKELAGRGIRVNGIAPGTILTPFHERFNTPEGLDAVRRSIPLSRLGTPEECAGVVLFLASPLSGFLTGETIEVNGGQWFA